MRKLTIKSPPLGRVTLYQSRKTDYYRGSSEFYSGKKVPTTKSHSPTLVVTLTTNLNILVVSSRKFSIWCKLRKKLPTKHSSEFGTSQKNVRDGDENAGLTGERKVRVLSEGYVPTMAPVGILGSFPALDCLTKGPNMCWGPTNCHSPEDLSVRKSKLVRQALNPRQKRESKWVVLFDGRMWLTIFILVLLLIFILSLSGFFKGFL